MLLAIEVRRLNHPAIKLHTVADVDLEKLHSGRFQLREPLLGFVIIDQRAHE